MTELHYDAIAIRHEPDGELLAFFKSPQFEQEDIVNAVGKILKFSNNFSINGVHTNKKHISFDNNLKIHRDLTSPTSKSVVEKI